MKVARLAYIGATATDLAAWKGYTSDVLGLEIGSDSTDRLLYLRMDERHHRLCVHAGDRNDVTYVGFEVANREALQAVAAVLDRNGVAVTTAKPNEAAERRVMEMLYFTCPHTGARIELSVGNEVVFMPHFTPARSDLSGFRTGELGMGHLVLYVKNDIQAAVDFYVRNLGFGISDWIRSPDGTPLAAFLHCNPRHHSLALIFYPPAPRLVQHVFLESSTLDDVASTYDVCRARKLDATTIGRHPNDRSVSFYFLNPSRWFFEYGWDLRTVDPQNWTTESYILRPGLAWGHEGLFNLEDKAK